MKDIINNIVCPACGKTITAKTFENWNCEHCQQDLKVEFYKINNKVCIGIDDNLSQFKMIKIKTKGGVKKCVKQQTV